MDICLTPAVSSASCIFVLLLHRLYEISRKDSLLTADVCPQCNFTEMLLGDYRPVGQHYPPRL